MPEIDPGDGYRFALGIRTTNDRTEALSIVVGAKVFVCDNLAFSGEVTMHRKHTANVFRDLPDLIYRMLSQVSSMRERTDREIAAMKAEVLGPERAHHLMVESVKANVVPASRLPKVLEAWEEPRHEEFVLVERRAAPPLTDVEPHERPVRRLLEWIRAEGVAGATLAHTPLATDAYAGRTRGAREWDSEEVVAGLLRSLAEAG